MKLAYIVTLVGLLCSCGNGDSAIATIVPNAERERVERTNMEGFTEIALSSGFSLILTQGQEDKVEVEAPTNLLPYIETKRTGSLLEIKRKSNVSFAGIPEVKLYVTYKQLAKLSASTLSTVLTTNTLSGYAFDLAVDNSSSVHLWLACAELRVAAASKATVVLEGSAEAYTATAAGGSKLAGFLFTTQTLEATLADNSTLDVTVAHSLSVVAAGSSTLSYKGNPTIVSQALSNGARLVDANE